MQITFIIELILIFFLCVKGLEFFNVKLKKFNCKVINMELLLIKSGEDDLG